MVQAGLLLVSGLGFVSAVAFFAVARRLQRRSVRAAAGAAHASFTLWWYGVGAFAFLMGGVVNAFTLAGVRDPQLVAAVRSVAVVLLLAALWHLTSYLAFIFSGHQRWTAPLGVYYGLVFGLLMYAFSGSAAVGVTEGAFGTRIEYAPAPDPRLLSAIFVAIGVPQIVGSLAYLALLPRLTDRTARYRVGLMALALAAWFAGSFAAAGPDVDSPIVLARPLLGLVAAASVVAAYAPPSWVRRRFGVHGLETQGDAA